MSQVHCLCGIFGLVESRKEEFSSECIKWCFRGVEFESEGGVGETGDCCLGSLKGGTVSEVCQDDVTEDGVY